ncbi:MAG: Uma2 family endonuclease [Caldilineaceae bacterium]|nr:Uma2 family endonuclease [Caldilineaceae bacterium]
MSSQETVVTQQLPQNGTAQLADEELFALLGDDGLYVSEEQYWADYYQNTEFTYEWNNGRLEQKPMTDYAQFLLYTWFFELLKDFLHVNPIARMTGLELGFRMELPHKVAARTPDLGVVLNTNPVPLLDKDRSYKGIFDICVESLSDSKQKYIDRDVIHKKDEYAEAGVQEYYILDERGKETQFYRLDSTGLYVPIRPQNGIIRSTVLPGFQFRYTDLYRLPKPPEMLDDVVYRDFTSPYVRAERVIAEEQRRRAEAEAARAQRERDRAEQERQRAAEADARASQADARAERYAALLRELGIDPDA